MRSITAIRGLVGSLVLGILPGPVPAFAGALPLFRHALLNMPAERFEVAVFHRGTLDSEEERLVNLLRDAPKAAGANIEVFTVDLVGQVEERLQLLWDSQSNAPLPWVVVRPPGARIESLSMWSGPLTANGVASLLDSPARRKISEGLLRGDSAVWVLLESSDVMRDEAAVDVLASELKAMETKLKPSTNGASFPISFSLVRVTRNDSAEELLVNALIHGERVPRAKPTAYPVFGRGCVLPGLAGRRLNGDNIREACALLTSVRTSAAGNGASPLRELLLSVNWDALSEIRTPVNAKSNVPTMAISSEAQRAAVSNGPPEPWATVAIDKAERTRTWLGLAVSGCVLVVAVSSYLLRRRRCGH
jgi:hypothetical protein